MPIYLGRPGSLATLPDPAPGVDATLTRSAGEHALLGGGRVIDMATTGRRTFVLRWEHLTDDEYATLEGFHAGANGSGPWLLVTDDTRWNYLTAAQAATGSVTGDAAGWTVTDPETLTTTDAAPVLRGPRVLRWSLPAQPTSARLTPTPPVGPTGWPAPAGVPWTFSVAARTTTGAATAGVVLRWLTPAGAEQAVTNADPVPVGSTGWAALTVTGVPPAGAVLLVPQVRIVAASVTAATVVHLDTPSLQPGATAGGWLPGRGLPQVVLTALSDTYPWAGVHDCEATLQEVG